MGVFGACTGAAAALVAAAGAPALVHAIVSRGGRPDLAGRALPRVAAPTLFIVGGHDHAVIQLNRHAMHQMTAPAQLHIVDGATHLFEEPGALQEVERLTGDWFAKYLQ
jgi:dienelactone hydrolase